VIFCDEFISTVSVPLPDLPVGIPSQG